MSDTRRTLAKSFREFGIIVLGVLVALWIDASWAWLQDRGDEAQLIEDLSSDFGINLIELERVIDTHERSATDARRLLYEGIEDLPDDSVPDFFESALQLHSFNARMGALESALSSGRIELLRDRELRAALTAWPGYLSDATEGVEWLRPLDMQQGTRFYFESLRIGYAPSMEIAVRDAKALLNEMAADPAYRNQLAAKVGVWEIEREEEQALHTETMRIVALLGGG